MTRCWSSQPLSAGACSRSSLIFHSAGSSRPQLSRSRWISSAAQSSPSAGISWMNRHSSGVLIWAYTSCATTSVGTSSASTCMAANSGRAGRPVLPGGDEQLRVEPAGGGQHGQVGRVVVGAGDEPDGVGQVGAREHVRVGGVPDDHVRFRLVAVRPAR